MLALHCLPGQRQMSRRLPILCLLSWNQAQHTPVLLDCFLACVCCQRVRKRKSRVHPLPKWSTVSLCAPIHTNMKPGQSVFDVELKPLLRWGVRMALRKETVLATKCTRPDLCPGCKPSNVDYRSLTEAWLPILWNGHSTACLRTRQWSAPCRKALDIWKPMTPHHGQ